MAKKKMYTCDWLYDVFGSNPDFEAAKIGSNVIEVIVPKLNDLAFAEGGAIRLIAHVLADANGKVKLCSVKAGKNGQVCYRLSTSVK